MPINIWDAAARIVTWHLDSLSVALFHLIVLTAVRALSGRSWLAAVSLAFVVTVLLHGGGSLTIISLLARLLIATLYVWIATRFGLVAAALCIFSSIVLRATPITIDSSAWYFGVGAQAVLVEFAIAACGFYLCSQLRRT